MIDGIDKGVLIAIYWGLAIIVMAWTWIPALISALGGTRYLSGGSNDQHGLEPTSAEPDYAIWAEQLREMGYEPLGTGWSRVNFAGPEWMLFSPLRVWISRAKHTYAVLQKAPAPFHFWPGTIFISSFPDGRMLTTDNNLAAQPDPELEHVKQGMVSLDLAEVEALHLATLEALRPLRGKPDNEMSMETLLHVMDRHYGIEAKQTHGRAGTQYLFAHGLIHICVSAPAAYMKGVGHWTVAVANLVLALILVVGENAQKRQFARMVRAAMRDRQRLTESKRLEMEP